MAIERTYYCDAPECERNAATATPPPYLPGGMLRVEWQGSDSREEFHFCGWDCVLKYAATQPAEEIILWGPEEPC